MFKETKENVKSVEDLFHYFSDDKGNAINPVLEDHRYYFRGQWSYEWDLMPKIARENILREIYRPTKVIGRKEIGDKTRLY